ncbi:hypothetical protein ACPOL_4731 [Acidisarcina polymorpha]|uniref:Uncharacterized protein n=1 Tax=Acidisarcina polymorpha TaxID=2211140 RepID=A0A2Z5G4P6_9BACT|nr:hypothetical protein ACPOL_4731 [Acidisarcina polymorpha]
MLKPALGEGRPQILVLGVSGSESGGEANRKTLASRNLIGCGGWI